MIGFTAACSTESGSPEESTTTTTTTTTSPAVTPTEKRVNPDATDGLTPPVTAPQPTVKHPDNDGN